MEQKCFIFSEKNRGSEANELQKAEGHGRIYWEVQGEIYGGGPHLLALIRFGSGDRDKMTKYFDCDTVKQD